MPRGSFTATLTPYSEPVHSIAKYFQRVLPGSYMVRGAASVFPFQSMAVNLIFFAFVSAHTIPYPVSFGIMTGGPDVPSFAILVSFDGEVADVAGTAEAAGMAGVRVEIAGMVVVANGKVDRVVVA